MAQTQRYLEITRGADHAGIRHRLSDLRAQLLLRIGDASAAAEETERSQRAIEALRTQLPDDYRERLDEHPWTQALRRIRAVP